MPPIGEGHTESLHLLIAVFKAYVEHHDLGKLRSDPFQMKTGPNLPGRQPDLLFVAKRKPSVACTAVPGRARGPRHRDRQPEDSDGRPVVKFKEYEVGGVREYWIVDPIRQTAEFYRLGRDGKFHLVEPKDGVFRSGREGVLVQG
jgi:Uma2 family endonuclease